MNGKIRHNTGNNVVIHATMVINQSKKNEEDA